MELNAKKENIFINRKEYPLPKKKCVIKIIYKDIQGLHIFLCYWKPFRKKEYSKKNMPGKGYLGTAVVIEGKSTGIGFHAWEQNDSEFLYYCVI